MTVRLFEDRQRVAPADLSGGPLVDGLQSQFDPDRLFGVQSGQKLEDLFPQTVRTGAEREHRDVVAAERFCVQRFQAFRVAVSIGKGLKIGDEMLRVRFSCDPRFCIPDLRVKIRERRGEVAGAALRAEGASFCPEGSVAVRTGAAGA